MPTNLFIVEGKALKFCLETFECFGMLIQDNGGIVVDEPDDETYILSDPNFQSKTKHQAERYHIEFAVESIHLGKLLDIRKYRIYEESKKESTSEPANKLNSSNVKLEPSNFPPKICVLELDQISVNNNQSPCSPSYSFTPRRALRSHSKEVTKQEESPRETKKRSRDNEKISKDKNSQVIIEQQVNNEKNDKSPVKNLQNEEENLEQEIEVEEKLSSSASVINNSNKRKIIYVDDDESDSGAESIILLKSDGSEGKLDDDSCESDDDDEDLEVSIDNCPQENKNQKDLNDPVWNGKRSRIGSNGEIIFKSKEEKDYRDPKEYHHDLSGTGKFILPWEQDVIIDYMIRSDLISWKGITPVAWAAIQSKEGILRYRNPNSIGTHIMRKILPIIDDWELPVGIRNQFINLREIISKRKKKQRKSFPIVVRKYRKARY